MSRKLTAPVIAIALLGIGVAGHTPLPAQACVFVREMARTGKGNAKISIWERVVYSLIEANEKTGRDRAPGQI